jgi:prepilin-type N-terminal cleavage/methylation domain-containing protein
MRKYSEDLNTGSDTEMGSKDYFEIGSQQCGYTLIEVVCVIAIIGSVILAVPLLTQWVQRQGVLLAVDQLLCDLNLARMTAISTKQTCQILFNQPGSNQYRNSVTGKIVDLNSYRGMVRFLQNGPDGDPMSARISFSQRGMAVPAGDAYLADGDSGQIFRILILAPGGIDVFRWEDGNWQQWGR